MRKLLKELFYVPKYGKVREKTMLAHISRTIAIIVLCLAATAFSAYAYFYHDVSSSHNVIKSASFETNVKIQIKTDSGEEVQVITSNYKSHIANLTANTTYVVTLSPTERSTAKTGFVILTAEGCKNRYHTEQLGVVGDSQTDAISFYIIPGADTKVIFLAHWGTSSFYGYEDTNKELYIKHGETVQIPVNNVPGTNDQNNSEPTTSVVTTPTVTAPTVTVPSVTVPTVTVPTVTAPTVTAPSVTVPTETTPTETEPTTPTETVHTVTEGETLADIAKLYKVTVDQLADYNEIADINNIQIGQALHIPLTETTTPTGATSPATEETDPTGTLSPTAPNAAQTDATASAPTESNPPQETI